MQAETLRVSAQRTQSVLTGVTTQSVGNIDNLAVRPGVGRLRSAATTRQLYAAPLNHGALPAASDTRIGKNARCCVALGIFTASERIYLLATDEALSLYHAGTVSAVNQWKPRLDEPL